MKLKRLAIADVVLITPPRFADPRGYFSETFKESFFRAEIGDFGFVQDNESFSAASGTIRGLHCQIPPQAQGKLVRVVRGAIFDVAVDLRRRSPYFGQHVAAELSADNGSALWVPPGFLHGFCTLTEDVVVLYKVTAPYDRAAERGVVWDDPKLAIPWPVTQAEAVLSEKDRALPPLAAAGSWFA